MFCTKLNDNVLYQSVIQKKKNVLKSVGSGVGLLIILSFYLDLNRFQYIDIGIFHEMSHEKSVSVINPIFSESRHYGR